MPLSIGRWEGGPRTAIESSNLPTNYTTLIYVNGKRGRGRPRMKWTTNIEKWTGMGYHQAERQTHDIGKSGEQLHSTLIKRPEHDNDDDH